MKVIFAGTPEFARVALERLCAARFEVPLVLTQPDRPAGRGMKEQASPVKQWALAHGLAASQVLQPRSLRLDGRFADEAQAARAAMEAVQADVMVVAAYGLILPVWALQMPRLGCLNIHASLLPRWRGAAPIHRAIEAGDAQTGVTIMQMDEGLDTGGMLLAERLPIAAQDTTATLHDKLAALGGRLIVEALEIAACGGLRATPQPEEGVSYARKVEKAESAIDWALPARQIDCRIRAFNPFPCASARLGDALPFSPWCTQSLHLLSAGNVASPAALPELLGRPATAPAQFMQALAAAAQADAPGVRKPQNGRDEGGAP